MKSINYSVRTDDKELDVWRLAAGVAEENLSEFIRNSVMLRIQNRQLHLKPKTLTELMGALVLKPYNQADVLAKDAKEIEELLEKSRKGKLEFVNSGKARVKPPKR
jgi:hypothetical protein